MLPRESQTEIKRIETVEPEEINKKQSTQKMEVSIPLFAIGYKDKKPEADIVKKHIAIQILLGIIIGKSSKLYQELYDEDLIKNEPAGDYEYDKEYAHAIITGASKDPKKLEEKFLNEVARITKAGISDEDFERNKKRLYGEYVRSFDDVSETARTFLVSYFKGINGFDYIETFENVDKKYVEQVLKEVFKEDREALSVIVGQN